MDGCLNLEEKKILLSLARQALETAVRGSPMPDLDGYTLPLRLREPGASFVTLTIGGQLRGCVGALEPYQSLAEDVREHAVAAALHDYRFPPVYSDEVSRIQIEISRLTQPRLLGYECEDELLAQLRPGLDGVVLREGAHRATFLPQVWSQIPDREGFLDHLCLKMGVQPDLWRQKRLQVFTYQVEEFHE